MELTDKQYKGLQIALERYNNKEKYTIISGYAGSGKTTLVRFIIDALHVKENDICYATFTGKAAEVLRQKGNKNAITLHKLLYKNIQLPDGTFIREKKEFIDYRVVVCDECSMIPKDMVDQLLHYNNIYVLFLGDGFQLPPIDKNTDNHLLDHPHIFLDEIMRQAAESEIIQVSMAIRENRPIPYFQGKEVQILHKDELTTGMLNWADQILVGTNATRISINNQMRKINGKSGLPQDGDKIICRRNYWEISGSDGNPIINGSIGYLKNSFETYYRVPKYLYPNCRIDLINGVFVADGGEYYDNLDMDQNLFLTGNKTLTGQQEFAISRSKKYRHCIPLEFEFGYAITVHRAQGSQWDKVLVAEERFPFNQEEHARWLYTAVTRAAEKLVIIRN